MSNRSDFVKLLLSSFISQSGSYFLTIALAATVLRDTGSLAQASFIFVLSYMPAIIGSAKLGSWIDRRLSRGLLIKNDLLSILATLLCGAALYLNAPLWMLSVVLAARSIFTFIFRTGTTVWIKRITPPELQTERIKLNALFFFLSTAMAGILAAQVLKGNSLALIIGVDVATYVASIVVLMMLGTVPTIPMPQTEETIGPIKTIQAIFRMPSVRRSFLFVAASQAIFQGAYSAMVSYLPITRFGLGPEGMGPFQLAASLGITLGFVVVWVMPNLLHDKEQNLPLKSVLYGVGATVGLVFSALAGSVMTSLFFFFAMNLFYECIWLYHFAQFFRASPKHAIGRYNFVLVAVSSFFMSLLTLSYAAAVDLWGFPGGLLSTLIIGIVLVSVVAGYSSRQRILEYAGLEERP